MRIQVIIPIYNSERFIQKCFDSVLRQSFDDWEVIAVDDGSTDNSWEIMKEYQAKDKRFRVFHQNNSGAGPARNKALSLCESDDSEGYIVFIDADDYIEKEYFELLASHDEDVVFIDAKQESINGKKIKDEKISDYAKYSKDQLIRIQMTGYIPWGGWRKAYKKNLLLDNSIRYSSHKVGEEAIFSFMALYYAETLGFIDKTLYTYVLHESSLSAIRLDDPWGDVVVNLKTEIKRLGEYETYADSINAFHVSAAAVSLRRLANNYSFKDYRRKAKSRINTMLNRIDVQYGVDSRSLSRPARIMSFLMNKQMLSIIYILAKVY